MIGLVIAAFVVGFLELSGLSIYQTIVHPDLFNPTTFGAGFATLIGATGAVHIGHSRWSEPPAGGQ